MSALEYASLRIAICISESTLSIFPMVAPSHSGRRMMSKSRSVMPPEESGAGREKVVVVERPSPVHEGMREIVERLLELPWMQRLAVGRQEMAQRSAAQRVHHERDALAPRDLADDRRTGDGAVRIARV